MSSLGWQLLRRLRRSRPTVGAATQIRDVLPDPPSGEQLAAALATAAAGRARDAEHLALLLLALDHQGNETALAQAAGMLAGCGPRVWLALDVATRRSWWHAPVWSGAALQRVAHGQAGVAGLVVASFHPDGHVREAATARLAELDEPVCLPALALRAADWVAQVRDRARIAAAHRLAGSPAQSLMGLAPVAFAVAARREGGWLADQIRAVLASAPPGVLNAGLAAADRRTRRAAYIAALAAGRLGLPELVHAATCDDDLPIRVDTAHAAVTAAVESGHLAAMRPLLAAHTAAVRAEAVHALARAGNLSPAAQALSDQNAVVRAVAQAALARNGVDPAQRYRDLVRGPRPPAGALAGLGETGAAEDTPLAATWLTHPQPRARAEAVRALRRLGTATFERIGPMLTDSSPAVARQAATALKSQAAELDPAWLADRLTTGNPRHVRMAAYKLLRERDTWTRILTDLQLIDDELLGLRNRARGDITNWLHREAATTYSMPPPATADKLREQLDAKAPILGPAQARLLRFHTGVDRPARG